jgi:hypothetical protein
MDFNAPPFDIAFQNCVAFIFIKHINLLRVSAVSYFKQTDQEETIFLFP